MTMMVMRSRRRRRRTTIDHRLDSVVVVGVVGLWWVGPFDSFRVPGMSARPRWADASSSDEEQIPEAVFLLAEVGFACLSLLFSVLVISVACLLFDVLLLCPYNMSVQCVFLFVVFMCIDI